MFGISPSTKAFFSHVGSAHLLGQTCARRLRPGELVGILRTITHRERRRHVELAGIGDARDELVGWNVAKYLACASGLPHIALHEAAVSAADLRDGLARREVHHVIDVDAGIRLAPAEYGNLQHASTDPSRRPPLWSTRIPDTA